MVFHRKFKPCRRPFWHFNVSSFHIHLPWKLILRPTSWVGSVGCSIPLRLRSISRAQGGYFRVRFDVVILIGVGSMERYLPVLPEFKDISWYIYIIIVIYKLHISSYISLYWVLHLHWMPCAFSLHQAGLAFCPSRPNRAVTIPKSFLGRPKPMNNGWRPPSRWLVGVGGIHSGSKLCPWLWPTCQVVSFFRIHYIWLKLRISPPKSRLVPPHLPRPSPIFVQLFFGGGGWFQASPYWKHLDVQTDTSWWNSSILKKFQHEVIQEAGELIFVPSGWHHEAEEPCPSLKDLGGTLLETNSKRAPEKLLLYHSVSQKEIV